MKEVITSLENKKIKRIKQLLENKNILKEQRFIIEGNNLIEEANKNGLLEEVYALETYDNYLNLNITYISEKIMKSISNQKSLPKIIGISKMHEIKPLGNKIVLLDNVQDPGNVGTIIRSCVAFDIDTIVISKDSANPYAPKVLRSAVGMIYNINIIMDDLNNIIPILKEKQIPIIATSLNTNNSINEIDNNKYAIVFGNEGSGIKKEILDICDKKIKIKISDKCESLNVAISNAIVLYSLYNGGNK